MTDLRSGEFGCLEAETWPVFLEWLREGTVKTSDAAREWLRSADLEEARNMWMEHSPLEWVRALADDP